MNQITKNEKSYLQVLVHLPDVVPGEVPGGEGDLTWLALKLAHVGQLRQLLIALISVHSEIISGTEIWGGIIIFFIFWGS